MIVIKDVEDVEQEALSSTNCVNHNGGDDQYDEDTGAGVNCGGSVTD